ncbi:uncharacterized protein STEHIDRAFT_154654 [Stereum hirsutum FP-91666 SS1]|uniref:uncharacterized protein n=1 Tax=Stereum hirsutum (strain FP-91666) TaxID=721885 RepID=UPI000440B740|nr:uncharacterized protein STEHIDRAFT_154654 [Stereum hirsutum FP-91666 SS1]EIM88947.1 hypothetical protein STEHIDRAFT_154654 [Stereum hirsutum FP-91666 SS1]
MANSSVSNSLPPAIPALVGPVLIGGYLGWGLFGISVLQTYFYFLTFPRDSHALKTYVGSIFILELFHTIVITISGWYAAVSGWGVPNHLVFDGWTYSAVPITSGITAALSQAFFYRRIYALSQRQHRLVWLVTVGLIAALSILSMLGAVTAGVFLAHEHDDIHLQPFFLQEVLGNIWLIGSAACDILNSGSLIYLLCAARQDIRDASVISKWSETTLTRLINMTAETGALTALFQTVDLVLFLAIPKVNYHEATALILNKLYYNSVLATLNSRAGAIRPGGQAESSDTSINPAVRLDDSSSV